MSEASSEKCQQLKLLPFNEYWLKEVQIVIKRHDIKNQDKKERAKGPLIREIGDPKHLIIHTAGYARNVFKHPDVVPNTIEQPKEAYNRSKDEEPMKDYKRGLQQEEATTSSRPKSKSRERPRKVYKNRRRSSSTSSPERRRSLSRSKIPRNLSSRPGEFLPDRLITSTSSKRGGRKKSRSPARSSTCSSSSESEDRRGRRREGKSSRRRDNNSRSKSREHYSSRDHRRRRRSNSPEGSRGFRDYNKRRPPHGAPQFPPGIPYYGAVPYFDPCAFQGPPVMRYPMGVAGPSPFVPPPYVGYYHPPPRPIRPPPPTRPPLVYNHRALPLLNVTTTISETTTSSTETQPTSASSSAIITSTVSPSTKEKN